MDTGRTYIVAPHRELTQIQDGTGKLGPWDAAMLPTAPQCQPAHKHQNTKVLCYQTLKYSIAYPLKGGQRQINNGLMHRAWV